MLIEAVLTEDDLRFSAAAATQHFLHDVQRLQEPADCRTARLYVFRLRMRDNFGIGAITEYLVSSLGRAMAVNRTLVIATRGPSLHWARGICPHATWGCLFHPLSTCTEADADLTGAREIGTLDAELTSTDRVVIGTPPGCSPELRTHVDPRAAFARLAARYLPHAAPGRAKKVCIVGVCAGRSAWVASLLTEFAFKPRSRLLHAFGRVRLPREPAERPLVAMHIRGTDKVKGPRRWAEAKEVALERCIVFDGGLEPCWPLFAFLLQPPT